MVMIHENMGEITETLDSLVQVSDNDDWIPCMEAEHAVVVYDNLTADQRRQMNLLSQMENFKFKN